MAAVAQVVFSVTFSILLGSPNTTYLPCLMLARIGLGNFPQMTSLLYSIMNIYIQDGGIPGLRPGFEMSTQVFFNGRGIP